MPRCANLMQNKTKTSWTARQQGSCKETVSQEAGKMGLGAHVRHVSAVIRLSSFFFFFNILLLTVACIACTLGKVHSS